MYASTLPRSNWLRRASIRLAWYRHMPASSLLRKLNEIGRNELRSAGLRDDFFSRAVTRACVCVAPIQISVNDTAINSFFYFFLSWLIPWYVVFPLSNFPNSFYIVRSRSSSPTLRKYYLKCCRCSTYLYMPAPRVIIFSIGPFVPFVCCQNFVNRIFWKWMNGFRCKLAQVVRWARTWNDQLWGQEVKG